MRGMSEAVWELGKCHNPTVGVAEEKRWALPEFIRKAQGIECSRVLDGEELIRADIYKHWVIIGRCDASPVVSLPNLTLSIFNVILCDHTSYCVPSTRVHCHAERVGLCRLYT